MTYDWQAAYGGATTTVLTAFATHLDALLAQPLPAVPLDDALVARRARLQPGSLGSARLFAHQSAAAQAVLPWRPSDALGRAD